MRETLGKVIAFGACFGCLFALFAYMAGFGSGPILYLLPLITAFMSALGGIIAGVVTDYLQAKTNCPHKLVYVLAFLVAAAVNTAITIVFLYYIGNIAIKRETIIIILFGLAVGALWGVYQLRAERIAERMRFLEELADKNRQLQTTTRRLAITEERNRMSRELHDSISQGLHGLVFTLRSLRNELPETSERVDAILTHMEATADSTLDELRHLIEALKPSLLAEQGLFAAVKTTADLFSQRQTIPVEIDMQELQGIQPEQEMAIYRIIQEAFANIEKHAAARHVQIRIGKQNNQIIISVKDDGIGFNKQDKAKGNGLHNMQQRAEDAGGEFLVISKPNLGTSIIVSFPAKG